MVQFFFYEYVIKELKLILTMIERIDEITMITVINGSTSASVVKIHTHDYPMNKILLNRL